MSQVVITGVGVTTAAAPNAIAVWQQTALGTVPTEQSSVPLGPSPFSHACQMADQSCCEALTHAGLLSEGKVVGVDPTRAGCTVSASKPFIETAGRSQRSMKLLRWDRPHVAAPEAINDFIADRFNFQGERRNVIAACATGAYAAAEGALWIEEGLCDVVLAGSVEPPAHPLIEAGFRRMGVMSSDSTMRPFDRQRSGFILSHGAGIVVLESERHARGRGAKILARLSGWGCGSDTHSPVAFNSNGELIAQVIRKALKRASLSPEAVRHVNAHGTATQLNDWIETQALIKAFGSHAEDLMISGTKSSTGHLLGAAGSLELVLTVLALQQQFVPPTAHLDDPESPLDYTPRQGHAAVFEHALSLSFGFGGPIGALLVSRA